MKLLQNITRQTWKTLDSLNENGWQPLINQLEPTIWHCNLTHESAPTPTIYFNDDGTFTTPEHHYRVHGYGVTPQEAINEAIEKVHKLLTPK